MLQKNYIKREFNDFEYEEDKNIILTFDEAKAIIEADKKTLAIYKNTFNRLEREKKIF